MQHRGVLAISSTLALTPALAWAQGAPPPPPPVADPVMAGTGTQAIDRGLILPTGEAEVEAGFYLFSAGRFDLFDIVDLALAGRYSFGNAEVFGGAELMVLQPGEDDDDNPTDYDALQVVHVGARIAAGTGDVKLRAARIGSGENTTWLEFDGAFELKRKVNPQVAVIGEAGGVFHSISFDSDGGDESAYALYLYGRGAGQFQATPEVVIEAGLQVSVPTISGDSFDDGGDDDPWNTVLMLYGEGAYTMGKIDFFGRGEIHRDRTLVPSQSGPVDLEGGGASFTGLMLGVRARL